MNEFSYKLSSATKSIILTSRKHPLFAIAYLVFFLFLVGSSLNSTPQANQNFDYPQTQTESIDTATNSAQAKAYKSENEVTIRWNEPIYRPLFLADYAKIRAEEDINCQLDFCVVKVPEETKLLIAEWEQEESSERYSKKFRLSN